MGYHTKKIEKGKLGEFSKVQEEYEEFMDSQNSNILRICELSDYYGALMEFMRAKHSNIHIMLDKFTNNINDVAQIDGYIISFNVAHYNFRYAFECNLVQNYESLLVTLLSSINDIMNCFNLSLYDLKHFSQLTSDAFKDGTRI
jgi:ribosomal protein S8